VVLPQKDSGWGSFRARMGKPKTRNICYLNVFFWVRDSMSYHRMRLNIPLGCCMVLLVYIRRFNEWFHWILQGKIWDNGQILGYTPLKLADILGYLVCNRVWPQGKDLMPGWTSKRGGFMGYRANLMWLFEVLHSWKSPMVDLNPKPITPWFSAAVLFDKPTFFH
jgi:hypothetical protein